MSQQLRLFSRNAEALRIRKALLRAAREIVQRHGAKVVAPELDLSPSALLDCIEERDRHHLDLEQLCLVIAFDERGEMAAALCDVQGMDPPTRKPQLDDSAKLERLYRSLAKAGKAGAAILEDADIGDGGKS